MSALAFFVLREGAIISGSDTQQNEKTRLLTKNGARVFFGHKKENVLGAEIVVFNGAIGNENEELKEARKQNLTILRREELLAEISSEYKTQIAVSGTHGKSTTTAMTACVLSGLNPTVHNGANILGANNNFIFGGKEIFLTEACEYKKSFLSLNPDIVVITNIDADHLDCYKDLSEIKKTFQFFADKASLLIKSNDDINSREIKSKNILTFGIHKLSDVMAENINFAQNGMSFDLVYKNGRENVFLNCFGKHNIYNALTAAAVGISQGVNLNEIAQNLKNYKGIEGRFQKIGEFLNRPIIYDYAHHPTEIKTTIEMAKLTFKKPFFVFQPHTFSRTLALFDEFVAVLKPLSCALFETYSAREKPIKNGKASDLAHQVHKKYFKNIENLKNFLQKTAFDAIILVGAGDLQNRFLK